MQKVTGSAVAVAVDRLAGEGPALFAFVPLTPGTIADLERVLRNYSERGE